MITFYGKYSGNITYSQNGEEKIIIECLKRMNVTTGSAVEIGGHNGKYLSNTALLADQGWKVKFVEADFNLWQESCKNWEGKKNVRSVNSFADDKNINAFVDEKVDVLSIDTDGVDYRIFQALKAKPKIVIIEIDSSIPPDQDGYNSEGGAGYKPMTELGISKGYFLLCHTGNLIFVDDQYRKLFPEIEGDGLSNSELYFKRDWLKRSA